MKKAAKIGALAAALIGAGALVAAAHAVPSTVPSEQAQAARDLLADARPARGRTFADEVKFIAEVQNKVLAAAPVDKEIPEGQPRNLTDLIAAGHGLCFDRSRAIEMVLRTYGFDARHAAIYSTAETGSALKSLATPQVPSHAVTEVKTQRGWMLVDSNHHWIGLTADGEPVQLSQLASLRGAKWNPVAKDPLPKIYRQPFTWVYGLYSRHGRFYPPYNAIPDLNWKELAANL